MIRTSTYSSRALASSFPPSLTSSSHSTPLPATSSTSSTAHPHNRIHIPWACSQREPAAHILLSPFTIASSSSMDDQHQHQHVTFPYILDGTGIDMSLDKNSHGQHDQSQSQAQSHGQNQVQMSPTDSTGATHSSSETLMYHPYAHPHHGPFTSSLHHDSSTPQLSQAHTLTLDPAQLRTSSIGPSRVLTRRQARMAAHAFTDTPRNGQQQQQQQFGEVRTFDTSPW